MLWVVGALGISRDSKIGEGVGGRVNKCHGGKSRGAFGAMHLRKFDPDFGFHPAR